MVKKAIIDYIRRWPNDEIYTPEYAVYPLLSYLPKDKIYWECTDFWDSKITKVLKDNWYKVIWTSFDFLTQKPNFDFDVIITNPPYSLKTQFLKKAYELWKPFCFLLPLTTLEWIERWKLFRKYWIELFIFDKRINFLGQKKNCWFNTSWFCWKILPKQLIFYSLK